MENVLSTIIILIIPVALLAHILYEIFFKKKFAVHTVEDFSQQRVAEGKNPMASDKENAEASRLLEDVFNCWTVVDHNANGEIRTPLKNKQMKTSTNLLNTIVAIQPTDQGIVDRFNDLSDEINNVSKRKFNGSKTFIIATIAVFVIISLISDTWAGAGFFGGGVVFYILASMTPQFMINRAIVKGKDGKRSFMTRFIGGLFGTVAAAKTYHVTTKYSDGSSSSHTDNSQTWISLAFSFIVLVAISMFIAVFGLINYIRNYWLYV